MVVPPPTLPVALAIALLGAGCAADTGDTGGTGGGGAGSSGSGGAAGGSGGGGGSAGGGGAGGSGGAGPDATCQESCTVEADCWGCAGAGAPIPLTFACTDQRCVITECDADDDCVAVMSLWTVEPCTNDAGCTDEVCIEVDGQGFCAEEPGATGCGELMGEPWVEQTRSRRDPADGGDVVVCTYPIGCDAGRCRLDRLLNCADDGDCNAPERCHGASGRCVECLDAADCAAGPLTVCTAELRCGCADGAECSAAGRGDGCRDGLCTCADVAACTVKQCTDTTHVCEPP